METQDWVLIGLAVLATAGVAVVLLTQPVYAGGGGGGGGQPLTGSQSFATILGPEPDGSYYVTIGVGVNGGSSPYIYTMTWGDGIQQGPQQDNAVFTRLFPGYPTSLRGTVAVQSSDGQTTSITVVAPFP